MHANNKTTAQRWNHPHYNLIIKHQLTVNFVKVSWTLQLLLNTLYYRKESQRENDCTSGVKKRKKKRGRFEICWKVEKSIVVCKSWWKNLIYGIEDYVLFETTSTLATDAENRNKIKHQHNDYTNEHNIYFKIKNKANSHGKIHAFICHTPHEIQQILLLSGSIFTI